MITVKPFSQAGIILSYKCSSNCRHCLYCCSNAWNGWMDIDKLSNIFREVLDTTPAIRGFHLAGGEVFLNFPLLLDAVRLARQYMIPLDYVETNASWYTDPESAEDMLTQVKDAGLTSLLISCSPLHTEYIPFEKTLGVINASFKVFGRHGTLIWLPEFLSDLTALSVRGTISFEDYAESVGEERATAAASYYGQLIPGGRAPYGLAGYLPIRPKEAFFTGNCSHELFKCGSGHFDLYGNTIPGICSGISIGTATDLAATYSGDSIESMPIVRVLARSGVKGLYQWAQRNFGYKALEGYAGKCHLCFDIRRYLVEIGIEFDELAPRMMYKRI